MAGPGIKAGTDNLEDRTMNRTGRIIINVAAVVGAVCIAAWTVAWVIGVIANWSV